MPDDARAELIGEIVETAVACADTGDIQPLTVLLHAWQSTAAIYADPHLSQVFKEPLSGEDFGPVEPPEVW